MRRIVVILSVLMTGSLASMAQSATDSIPFDTLAADKVVDAISPDTLPADVVQGLIAHLSEANTAVERVGLAPRRASGTKTLLDSSIVVDQNDVPVRKLIYEYDRLDRNFRTTTYYYTGGIPNGTSSVQEKVFDGTSTASTIMTTNYTWDGTRWRGTTRTETVYNDARKQIALITYTWNTAYAFWTPTASTTYQYEYNATKRTYYQTEKWDYAINAAFKKLVASQRLEQAFDVQGNNILKTYYKGGMSNGVWQHANNDTQNINAYQLFGTANKQVLAEARKWSNNQWVGTSRTEYDYNEDGSKQTKLINYQWNASTLTFDTTKATYNEYTKVKNAWQTSMTMVYTWTNGVKKGTSYSRTVYNNTNKDSVLTYSWNNSLQDWVLTKQVVVLLNEQGKTYLNETLNTNVNTGVQSGTRTLLYYNSAQQQTAQTIYRCTNSLWEPSDSTETLYANNVVMGSLRWKWSTSEHRWILQAGGSRQETMTGEDGIPVTINYTCSADSTWTFSTITKTISFTDDTGASGTVTMRCNSDSVWYLYSGTKSKTWTDASGATVSMTWKITNTTDSVWTISSGTKIPVDVKDAANHTILQSSYYCGADSVWKVNYYRTWTYDEGGHENTHYDFKKDSIPNYGTIKYYNEAGRLIQDDRLTFSSGNWIGDYSWLYDYDGAGHTILTVHLYAWQNNNWRAGSKDSTAYDAAGRVVLTESYSWNGSAGVWSNTFKYLTTYGANGLRETYISMVNDGSNHWVNSRKEEYTYSGTVQIEKNTYTWVSGQWLLSAVDALLDPAVYGTNTNGTPYAKTSTNITYNLDGSIVSYEKTTNYYNNE